MNIPNRLGMLGAMPRDSHFYYDKGQNIRFELDDIRLITSKGNYVLFSMTSGSFTVRGTLENMMANLPSNEFAQINRKHILPIRFIKSFSADSVITINNEELPLTKVYFDELVNNIVLYGAPTKFRGFDMDAFKKGIVLNFDDDSEDGVEEEPEKEE